MSDKTLFIIILPATGILISLLQQHGFWRVVTLALSGVTGIIPAVMLILLWLRTLEQRDASLDAPVVDREHAKLWGLFRAR